jgi:uncharacterized protein (TIGR02246 family)
MPTIGLLLALACGSSSTLSAQGRAADEAAIRAQAVAVENATNKRDAAALVALSMPDGDEVFMDGPRVAGQAAMRKSQEAAFATWSPTMRLTLTVTGIRFLGQDAAIVEAEGRVTEGAVRTSRATWVMVRRDGKWLFAAVRVYQAERQQ